MTSLLFHVQHLVGIGHLRRAERLVRAAVESGLTVHVARGGVAMQAEDWGGADVHGLPPLTADPTHFGRLLTDQGTPPDDAFKAGRRDALLALFERVKPDLLLLEGYPFARRALRFELEPLLAAAANRKPPPKIAVSLRDILVTKDNPARNSEILGILARSVDQILVHGDPRVIALEASFPAAVELKAKIRYTGYVGPEAPVRRDLREGVVVSVGGGAVGADLLIAAAAARPMTRLADAPWSLVTGPAMPDSDARRIEALAGAGLTVYRNRPDLPTLMAQSVLSVSQAGYNTVLDLLAAGPRAVLVPFAAPGETEQTQRCDLLAAAGVAVVTAEQGLTPERLAQAIEQALDRPAPNFTVAMDGAAETARLLKALAR
jgi:predicted glycosyltransferase